MGRSSLRHAREIHCVDSAGEYASQHGEISNDPCPGQGPYLVSGEVVSASQLFVTWSTCVQLNSACSSPYNAFVLVNDSSVTISSIVNTQDNVLGITLASGEIVPGDVVEFRYIEGDPACITDCSPDEVGVGSQQIQLNNTLALADGQVLLESGGVNLVLVEDDTDDTAAVEVENEL